MSRATKLLWRLFFGGLILFVLLIIAINLGLLGYMPPMKELENPDSAVASQVFASDGTVIGKYYVVNRSPAKFKDISPHVFNALIATEDARFREHSGIDGIAVLRAVVLLGSKGGGSTITQQLAKNLFPRQHVNFFTMPIIKLKEWIMAVKLERNLTKDEIITLYLNTVPFGYNTYGIKNAALTFFNVTPDKLTVDQAAVLVGMLKGNTLYNPRRNPKNSLNRRNTVIDQMVKYDYLTEAQGEKYKALPLVLHYSPQNAHEGLAPYFRRIVEQAALAWCKQHEKPDGEKYDLYRDGLKIYTTLDPRLQRYAEEAVTKQMKLLQADFSQITNIKNGTVWNNGTPKEVLENMVQRSARYLGLKDDGLSEKEINKNFNTPVKMTVFTWENAKHQKDTTMTPLDSIKYMRSFLQAGFLAIDPATGEVKAWVGGIDHQYFQYDHVNITTKRQVGSTIKPILYCLAVDNGYSPCGMVSTAPQLFPGQKRPYDAGGSKFGDITMKKALANSINNASLFLLNQVGIDPFIQFAHKCGISSDFDEVPSIALGVTDISLYEMLWAYSMFPERGINTKPIFITRIEDKNGNLLQSFAPIQKEIVNERTAYKMVKMMEGVVNHGTGGRLRWRYGLKGDIAGKTGTTNNQSDAWFIGYTPQILAGAWVGCDDRFLHFRTEASGQGAAAALPIWAFFMQKVEADAKTGITSAAKFEVPKNFVDCESMDIWGADSTATEGLYEGGDSTAEPVEEIPPSEWQ